MIHVVGIDTGWTATGLVCLAFDGRQSRIIDHLTIETEPTAKKRRLLVVDDHLRRIRELRIGIDGFLRRGVQVVSMEAFSQHRNASSAARQAFGYAVAVVCCGILPIVQWTPQEIHKRLSVPKPTPLPKKAPADVSKDEKRAVERARAAVKKANKEAAWTAAVHLCEGPWGILSEHEADAACTALASLCPPVDIVQAALGANR